jgi:hypothetical protein
LQQVASRAGEYVVSLWRRDNFLNGRFEFADESLRFDGLRSVMRAAAASAAACGGIQRDDEPSRPPRIERLTSPKNRLTFRVDRINSHCDLARPGYLGVFAWNESRLRATRRQSSSVAFRQSSAFFQDALLRHSYLNSTIMTVASETASSQSGGER